MNQLPYEIPKELEKAIEDFVTYYNHHRYHKELGNVTPSNVLNGRREQVFARRKEVERQTINSRRRYNQGFRELANAA